MNQSRAIIEALRCGTPSAAAVATLGCRQPSVEQNFANILAVANRQPIGVLIKGGFGTGKSHTLEYLYRRALDEGYLCSRTTINKETALFDPNKVFQSLAYSSVAPGKCGIGLVEVLRRIRLRSQEYREVQRWVGSAERPVDSRFSAVLSLLELRRSGGEDLDLVIQFCLGEPIGTANIKSTLKKAGAIVPKRFYIEKQRLLALQRFQFVSRLIRAAGFPGWVVFVDELELIGCYSRFQRLKSYAELARFMGLSERFTCPGLKCVFAITDDYSAAILDKKSDLIEIPKILSESNRYITEATPACLVESGMKCIENGSLSLQVLDHSDLMDLYTRVKALHSDAYNWNPPDAKWPEQLQSTRMRHYIKSWITEWDMTRLYPDEPVELEPVDITTTYDENQPLEDENEETGDDKLLEDLLGRILVN